MKIWTLTTDDDNGTQTAIHFTAEAANAQAVEIVTAWYDRHLRADTEPREHDEWRETYELLGDTIGFNNYLTFEEHDISGHPDLQKNAGDDPAILAAYRNAARDLHQDDGTCEIDDGATVSMGDDPGAYVQAWVWVSAADAGIDTDDEGEDE